MKRKTVMIIIPVLLVLLMFYNDFFKDKMFTRIDAAEVYSFFERWCVQAYFTAVLAGIVLMSQLSWRIV